jgi:predicted amidohydrolase YtcJ
MRTGLRDVAQQTVIANTTVVTVDPTTRSTTSCRSRSRTAGLRRRALTRIVARFPGAHAVDGSGKVVMPGFANIHTHFTLIIAKASTKTCRRRTNRRSPAGLAPLPGAGALPRMK